MEAFFSPVARRRTTRPSSLMKAMADSVTSSEWRKHSTSPIAAATHMLSSDFALAEDDDDDDIDEKPRERRPPWPKEPKKVEDFFFSLDDHDAFEKRIDPS